MKDDQLNIGFHISCFQVTHPALSDAVQLDS